jgi:two-component system phosphate regulon sensor histidine kinase PhoR
MVYSSRGLALLLAVCIALITSLFLSLLKSVDFTALLVAFGISFSVSYILTFIVLEFLIFRELAALHRLVSKLKKKELSKLDKQKSVSLNPLKTINEDIYSPGIYCRRIS